MKEAQAALKFLSFLLSYLSTEILDTCYVPPLCVCVCVCLCLSFQTGSHSVAEVDRELKAVLLPQPLEYSMFHHAWHALCITCARWSSLYLCASSDLALYIAF